MKKSWAWVRQANRFLWKSASIVLGRQSQENSLKLNEEQREIWMVFPTRVPETFLDHRWNQILCWSWPLSHRIFNKFTGPEEARRSLGPHKKTNQIWSTIQWKSLAAGQEKLKELQKIRCESSGVRWRKMHDNFFSAVSHGFNSVASFSLCFQTGAAKK